VSLNQKFKHDIMGTICGFSGCDMAPAVNQKTVLFLIRAPPKIGVGITSRHLCIQKHDVNHMKSSPS